METHIFTSRHEVLHQPAPTRMFATHSAFFACLLPEMCICVACCQSVLQPQVGLVHLWCTGKQRRINCTFLVQSNLPILLNVCSISRVEAIILLVRFELSGAGVKRKPFFVHLRDYELAHGSAQSSGLTNQLSRQSKQTPVVKTNHQLASRFCRMFCTNFRAGGNTGIKLLSG